MRLIPGFILREVADTLIAVPSGPAAHKLSGLLEMNGSAKLLFELLQENRTEEELLEALLQTYDTDKATAQTDLREILEQLANNGLLIAE